MTGLTALAPIAAVLAALPRAEVVAHRVGEPLATLILALAVTIVDACAGGFDDALGRPGRGCAGARHAVRGIMIVCNGVVGLCLLVGALRHHVLVFPVPGTDPALSVLARACLVLACGRVFPAA